jgi:hypothetical protein
MSLRLIALFLLLSCSDSKVSEPNTEIGVPAFSIDAAKELLQLIDVDPRPELRIYVFIDQRLTDTVTLLTVRQSRMDPKGQFQNTFKYSKHDVFIYDYATTGSNDDMKYFETDSPVWKIMVVSSSKKAQFFLMEQLNQSTNDSTRKWSLN